MFVLLCAGSCRSGLRCLKNVIIFDDLLKRERGVQGHLRTKEKDTHTHTHIHTSAHAHMHTYTHTHAHT